MEPFKLANPFLPWSMVVIDLLAIVVDDQEWVIVRADMDLQVVVWLFYSFLLPTVLLTGNFCVLIKWTVTMTTNLYIYQLSTLSASIYVDLSAETPNVTYWKGTTQAAGGKSVESSYQLFLACAYCDTSRDNVTANDTG